MLAVPIHLRGQEMRLRDIAARLVIATGKKKGEHPSPATVLLMLREHDEKAAAADVNLIAGYHGEIKARPNFPGSGPRPAEDPTEFLPPVLCPWP